jgi:hypothetical protein
MAITRIGEAEASAIDDGELSVTLPSMEQNDIVVVMYFEGTSNITMTTTGYTITSLSGNAKIAWKRMGASPDATIEISTGNSSGNNASAAVAIIFRGVDTTTAMDATVTTSFGFAGSAADSPSITTVTDGAAVISAFGRSIFDTAITAPSGYGDQVDASADDTADAAAAMAWVIKASHGAENPGAWTADTSNVYQAATMALRPLVVAAGQPTVKRWGGIGFNSINGNVQGQQRW